MKHLALACVVAIVPVAAAAEPWIDYDLLMQQQADKVVVTTGADGETRTLDMGNGVVVTCTDDSCTGTDRNGAVGCVWTIYSSLLALAEICAVPADQTERLRDVYGKLADFVAANAVPPRSTDDIDVLHRQRIEDFRAGKGPTGPIDCAEILSPESDVMMMVDMMRSDSSGYPDEVLATPRLPVMQPCL